MGFLMLLSGCLKYHVGQTHGLLSCDLVLPVRSHKRRLLSYVAHAVLC